MLQLSRRRGWLDSAKTLEQSQHLQPKEHWDILYSLFAPLLDHDLAGQNPVRRATAKLLAAQT
jgi:hypothetical protein